MGESRKVVPNMPSKRKTEKIKERYEEEFRSILLPERNSSVDGASIQAG
jgi:hypothetical protein